MIDEEGFNAGPDADDAFGATPEAMVAGADRADRADEGDRPSLDLIMDIPVTMQVVLGKAAMPVGSLVKLGRGAVVKLDTSVGDPVDLMVNGRVVARGEIVVLENEQARFGVTLTEIVSPGARPARNRQSAA